MEETIAQILNQGLKHCFDIEGVVFAVERPKDISHGDYATNVALVLSKQLGKSPREIADTLVDYLNHHKVDAVAEVSVAGAGFINFVLNANYFEVQVKNILSKKSQWGKSAIHEGKTILVEHSSPNLFKSFHVGHVMNNTIGESIKRLAQFSGAVVETMSFPSDISLGVAKAIFVLLEKQKNQEFEVPANIEILADAYVEGTKRFAEDESIHGRVKEIADNLYGEKPSSELSLYEVYKKFNIAYFENITKRLGSEFDSYVYESEAGEVGKKIVLENRPVIFTESEGAIVYIPDEARKDINTAVFINSQGNPTYEAKDIGLLSIKFANRSLDFSIFITDREQVPHFQVVLDAATKINPEWSAKSVHVNHGRMSFKGQKMSSRLGGVPLAETLINTIGEEVKERSPEMSAESIDAVAIAALKFSILRTMAGKDINFDPETSLSFEGDSGPYLQYGVVRAQSILNKTGEEKISDVLPEGWQTTNLEKVLIHFPEVVEHAIAEWSPHFMVTYVLELAQAFNSWYGNTLIINEADPAMGYRLAITKAFIQTMSNGLYVLGIPLPERM